jgi:hypothetical protein
MSKEILFDKSFASHEKSKYWSDKNKLKPKDIFKGTHDKYLFNCNICNHEFYGQLSSITLKKPSWCSFCTNKNLCKNLDCNVCFENSFASNEKEKYWSRKNELKPREVFKCNNNKFIFDCNICNHEFNISFNISLNKINDGNWCSYCSNPPKKLCNNIDCNSCFEKSFASNEKSKYWSDINKLKPREVF